MSKDAVVESFNQMGAQAYDKINAHFSSMQQHLYFLNALILQKLPNDANILCVGVGTGADILDLAQKNPGWRFTGIEPSKKMLDGCIKKMASEQLSDRCEFFHGYLSEYKSNTEFDAVTCLLVMHFIKDMSERKRMYVDMNRHLKTGGYIIIEEMSGDVTTDAFKSLFKNWQSLLGQSDLPEALLDQMILNFTTQLAILPPSQTTQMIQDCGFSSTTPFFHSLLLRAWYAQK